VIRQQVGGLYVDTDFECLAPFDELHASLEFYTGFSNTAAAAEVRVVCVLSACKLLSLQ